MSTKADIANRPYDQVIARLVGLFLISWANPFQAQQVADDIVRDARELLPKMDQLGLLRQTAPDDAAQSLAGRDEEASWRLFRDVFEDWLVRRHEVDAQLAKAAFDKLESPALLQSERALLCWQLHHWVHRLGALGAIEFLAGEDPVKLFSRVRAFESIYVERLVPLVSVEALPGMTEEFISHLEGNRAFLVRTGLPRVSYGSCSWMDWHLGALYYVREPVSVRWARDKRGNPVRLCGWSSKDPRPYHTVASPRDAHLARYNDVPIIKGLRKEDASRIEANREKLFDLKLAVLRCLVRGSRGRDAIGLWQSCLDVLTRALTAEEAQFWLRMDHLYLGYDITFTEDAPSLGFLHPGGLTDLLQVIGCYLEELSSGRWGRLWTGLRRLNAVPEMQGVLITKGGYLEAAKSGRREALDEFLDSYSSCESEARPFWTDYVRRVNEALENELYEDVVVRIKVKRKLVHRFEPQVRIPSQWLNACLEANGQVPQLALFYPGMPSLPEATATLSPEQGAAETEHVPDMLRGWEEIAEFLRVSVATAKRWEKESDMPIIRAKREGGGKNRGVAARKRQLALWMDRNTDRGRRK